MSKPAPVFRVPLLCFAGNTLKSLIVPCSAKQGGTRFCNPLILLSVPVFPVFPPIGVSVARNTPPRHHAFPMGATA